MCSYAQSAHRRREYFEGFFEGDSKPADQPNNRGTLGDVLGGEVGARTYALIVSNHPECPRLLGLPLLPLLICLFPFPETRQRHVAHIFLHFRNMNNIFANGLWNP